MILFRQARIRAAQRRLASLRAELAALKELLRYATTLPGAIFLDLRDIQGQIAETEELLRQLGEPVHTTNRQPGAKSGTDPRTDQ